LQAPAALRIPQSLTNPSVDYAGILRDGWVEQDAHLVLAGGPASEFVIRGEVAADDQKLDITVNGEAIASTPLGFGPLDLRLPLPGSETERRIELHWAHIAAIGAHDPRQAAARLTYIGARITAKP
jgi:hypothetical protein